MKKLIFLPLFLICSFPAFSQWTGTTLDGKSYRNGNVGIGTSSPDHAKLTINSGATQLRLENSVLGEEARMRFYAKNAEGNAIHADIGLYATGTAHHQGFLGFKVPHHSTAGSGYDMVINHLGKVGIGTTNPGSLLTIRKTADSNSGHLQFGNHRAVSGEVSSTMSLAGWGIQHAGISWVPNGTSGQGKLHISFGGSSNPYLNSKEVTFQSNGNVGIGTTSPISKLEVNGNIKAGGNYLNVLSYQLAGTPTNGVKIKTQIPFKTQGGMFSIDIKGYNYIKSSPVGVKLNFYMFGSPNPEFIRFGASSSGNWNPKIKLAEENGLVVVFIDEKEYYLRFGVDVYAPWHSYQNDAIFNNWTAVDEALSGTHQHVVNVGYYNSFGEVNTSGPLTVAGKIHAREVKVTATAGGADFVFADDYALPKLEEVDAFVKANKHLPEIPSAAEMEKNGIHLAEMNIKLLQKVEELTLYVIEQQKLAKQAVEKNEELEKRINVADQKVEVLNQELQEIKEMIKKKM